MKTSAPLRVEGARSDVPHSLSAYAGSRSGEWAFRASVRVGRSAIVCRKGDTWSAWWTATGDAPATPSATTRDEALKRLQQVREVKRNRDTSRTRGQWSGQLECDGGQPVVTLERRLAPGVTVRVRSTDTGWVASGTRAERWYAASEEDERAAFATLAEACDGAILIGLGLARACVSRDTTRRAAIDPAYAAAHPERPEREVADASARMTAPTPAKAPKAAPKPTKAPKAAAPTPAKPRETAAPKPVKASKPAPNPGKAPNASERDQQLLLLIKDGLRGAMEEAA